MAMPRKRKRGLNDKSHTFLVPPDVAQSFSLGPVAIVHKVSADHCRTLSQAHSIRPPTPPLDLFLDDSQLPNEEGSHEIFWNSDEQPVIVDFMMDLATERRKQYMSSVSDPPS